MSRTMRLLCILVFLLAGCSPAASSQPAVTSTQTTNVNPTSVELAPSAEQPTSTAELAPTGSEAPATIAPAGPNSLTMQSQPEDIRQRMLYSHTFWKALWADAAVTWYDPSGAPVQVFHLQIWVEQPNMGLVLSTSGEGAPDFYWVSDGTTMQSTAQVTPTQVTQANGPFTPPPAVTDTITPYPLTGIMDSPINDLIFPTGLAQRNNGSFKVSKQETIAGRNALVLDWTDPQGGHAERMWVDVETGVLLRFQSFGDNEMTKPQSDQVINAIRYETSFPPDTFSLQAAPTKDFQPLGQ